MRPPPLEALAADGALPIWSGSHRGAPVLEYDDRVVAESGAIIDYLVRRHGGGRLAPDPASPPYDDYVHWLHYAEGSAILPFMLALYVGRLGEAGEPLRRGSTARRRTISTISSRLYENVTTSWARTSPPPTFK